MNRLMVKPMPHSSETPINLSERSVLGAVSPIELHGGPRRQEDADLLAEEQPGRDPERDGSERRRHIDAGQ